MLIASYIAVICCCDEIKGNDFIFHRIKLKRINDARFQGSFRTDFNNVSNFHISFFFSQSIVITYSVDIFFFLLKKKNRQKRKKGQKKKWSDALQALLVGFHNKVQAATNTPN